MPKIGTMLPKKQNAGRDPDFICVGPPKCATTWLDNILRMHPEIFMPENRKEVFFFTKYYDRGFEWYRNLFANAGMDQICGEISPSYIRKDNGLALQRIAEFKPDVKIIAIFRHPLDRAFSLYAMNRENGKYCYTFREALDMHPRLYEGSNYSAHVENLRRYFADDQLHIMIYEELFADKHATDQHLRALAKFLDVAPDGINAQSIVGKVRAKRGQPRFPRLVSVANRIQTWLKDADLDHVIHYIRRSELDRLLLYKKADPTLDPGSDAFKELCRRFEPDINAVEEFLGREVPAWRQKTVQTS